MNYTPAQLHEMLKTLPPDVNEAIGSVNYIDTLIDIEKKYHLHLDQADALGNEIFKLMLGLTQPQQFIGALKASVGVSDEAAKVIATEVNEKIFRPIKDSLMQIHKMKDSGEIKKDNTSDELRNDSVPQGEIPEEYGITNNAKNNREETQPVRSEVKNIAENKLSEPFSLPKKTSAPDPYRESTI